jgi:hypothetical protein
MLTNAVRNEVQQFHKIRIPTGKMYIGGVNRWPKFNLQ